VIHFIQMLVSGIVLVYNLVARAVCDSLYSNVGFCHHFSMLFCSKPAGRVQ
jgi:hypothetical protein